MSVNVDIQDRVRDEITSVLAQHDGNIDLDTLSDLKYLDMVLSGELQLYLIYVYIHH